jgi:diacylglycerol kinase (ATP)
VSEPEASAQTSAHEAAPEAAPPVVILNPASDRGRTKTLRGKLERALMGGRGELVLTDGRRAAEKLAAQAAAAGRGVVAVGGDGTVTEAASGILATGRKVPFGIVPAGSGNDYAYVTLRLPHDPLQALEIALAGPVQAMDAGQVNERYFANSLSVGIDANMAAAAERLKRVPLLRGQALYWASALQELLLHYDRCPRLRVTCDGEDKDHRYFAVVAVSIGPTYGGGFQINPGADPRDGYFDLCTIWKPALPRALRLLPMVEQGKHSGQPEVVHRRVRRVTLEGERPIFAQLDGEVISAQRFEAQILPGALLVRQPSVAVSA